MEDQVAQSVRGRVAEGGKFALDNCPGSLFAARDAGGFHQFAKERDIHSLKPYQRSREWGRERILDATMTNATVDTALPTQEQDWLVETEFLRIQFQHGLPPEVGINGVQVEDVMNVVIQRLERYQRSLLACSENEEAIKALHLAKDAMARRRQRREKQGVFHTYSNHTVERSEDLEEDFSATGA